MLSEIVTFLIILKNLLLCQLNYFMVFIRFINEQYLVRRIMCWLELIEFLTQWCVFISEMKNECCLVCV